MITGFKSEDVPNIPQNIEDLLIAFNATLVEDAPLADVVVTPSCFRRTSNLLAALSKAGGVKGVVDLEWVMASAAAMEPVPVDNYLIRDSVKEDKWRFRMTDTLARGTYVISISLRKAFPPPPLLIDPNLFPLHPSYSAAKQSDGLLVNYSVCVTPGVCGTKTCPKEDEMYLIVVSGGGQWITPNELMTTLASNGPGQVILITTTDAMKVRSVGNLATAAVKTKKLAGNKAYDPQFLFLAALRHQLEL